MVVKVIQLGTHLQSTMAEDQDVPKLLGGEYVKVTQGTQVQSFILEDQDALEDGYGKITQENQVQSKMSRTPDQVLPKPPDGGYGWLVVFGCILQWVLFKMKLLSLLLKKSLSPNFSCSQSQSSTCLVSYLLPNSSPVRHRRQSRWTKDHLPVTCRACADFKKVEIMQLFRRVSFQCFLRPGA